MNDEREDDRTAGSPARWTPPTGDRPEGGRPAWTPPGSDGTPSWTPPSEATPGADHGAGYGSGGRDERPGAAFPSDATGRYAPAAAYGEPEGAAPVFVLSGWWRRVGANVVDGLVVGVTSFIIGFVVGLLTSGSDSGDAASLVVSVVAGLASLLYSGVMVGMTDGRTVGKMATGIRVVRVDGQPWNVGSGLVRELLIKSVLFGVLAVVTLGLGLLLDLLWPLWDRENRALHDMVAKTRVVIDSPTQG